MEPCKIEVDKGAGLLSCLLLLGLACGAVQAQVSEQERQALVDFYLSTNGDDWFDNSGWLGEEGSECSWHGVHCLGLASNDAYVTYLRLPANGLGGTLPDTLAELERLGAIDLRANRIGGPLPPSLADFPKLHSLELGGNRLTGAVPGELLSGTANSIGLSDNRLDGYTEASGPAQGGMSMNLSGNPISELPPISWRDSGALSALHLNRAALGEEIDLASHPWSGLRHLSLDANAITGLGGVTSGTLVDLRHLSLAENAIHGAWPINGQVLHELRVLILADNDLESPPPADLSEHPSLGELHLARNQLRGQDLGPLFAMPSLYTLDLRNNPLQALPSSLPGAVSALLRLNLASAGLAGDPPEWFADLSIRHLDLSGNELTGDLEPWLAAVQDVT